MLRKIGLLSLLALCGALLSSAPFIAQADVANPSTYYPPTDPNYQPPSQTAGNPNYAYGPASSPASSPGCSVNLPGLGSVNDLLGTGGVSVGGGSEVPVRDKTLRQIDASNQRRDDFLNCIARTIARAALQQITVSTVNWINSGFNGEPSFITNYQQFFQNVADQAVSDYLAGSDLAFLCSPFRAQVKTAVAQAYALSFQPPLCTLSQVSGNIDAFMNGDFSQGGWQAYLAFLTEPTNNPYGAYMYAQSQSNSAVVAAQNQQAFDLQLGQGFLSTQQEQNCRIYPANAGIFAGPGQKATPVGSSQVRICDLTNVTPGIAISQSLNQTLGINTQSLENAKYFDEVIGTLISQLMQNTLYGGFSNLSSGGGYGSNALGNSTSQVRSNLSQNVLQNLAPYEEAARQITNIETNNISDLRGALAKAADLASCQGVSTTTSPDAPGISSDAVQTLTTIGILNGWTSDHQAVLAKAQASLAALAAYRAQIQATNDTGQIENILQAFTGDVSHHRFLDNFDLEDAQNAGDQLQKDLSNTNAQTRSALDQCHGTATPTS